MGVWDSFWNGAQMGEHYGDMRRNREAFQSGGYDGVERAAANVGDMQTAMSTRRFQDDRMQQAYQRMEQIRPLALGALDRVGQLPVEQRTQFLNQPHIRQRFIDWGITPEQYDAASQQIANPETGAEALASYRAAFTQHQDPNWQLMGRTAVAIQPDGQFQVGGTLPESVTAGQWRPATSEEAQAWQLPPGTQWDVNVQTGERRLRYRPNAPHAGQGGSYPDDGYDYEVE